MGVACLLGTVASALASTPARAVGPSITITDPAGGTVKVGSRFRLGWVELPASGAPIIGRTVSQYIGASLDGSCGQATYALAWTNTTANRPLRYPLTGLAPGTCYRWTVTLTDTNGASIKKWSGYAWRPPSGDPAVEVTFPIRGAFTDAPPNKGHTLRWSETASAGVVARSVTEEVAPMAADRTCNGVAWAPARSLAADVGTAALTDLAPETCYRYTVSITDANGLSASMASGPLLITATPPPCIYGDVLTTNRGDANWQTSLVDTTYRVKATYVPADLVDTSGIYHMNGSYRIRAIAKADLWALANAARAAGRTVDIYSAYRSYKNQKRLFNDWLALKGWSKTLVAVARAGHSEHQLGTAADFKTYGDVASWRYDDWALTKAGAWMANNAWKYGWLMTYPKPKSPAVTCYQYEPWHYRYFGRTLAKAIHDSGLSPREYLWLHGSLAPGA